jgi:hypothetical protein
LSVRVLNLVWTRSTHKGSELLLLLAIADNADDEGFAFPGIPLLAAKTRLTPRAVQYAMRKILACDNPELVVVERGRKGKSNRYRLMTKTLRAKADALDETDGRIGRKMTSLTTKPVSSEPSGNRKEPSGKPAEAALAARPRNPIWDVLVELYGPPLEQDRAKTARGRIVGDLRERLIADGIRDVDLAVSEVRRRYVALAADWGSKATARALVEHWHTAGKLAAEPTIRALSADELIKRAFELGEEEVA